MEKSIEFILDDKLTLGIAIYGYSLGWGGGHFERQSPRKILRF